MTSTPPNIMIVGSAGSGKSTLATKIAALTGGRVVHMDHIYWNPGWEKRTDEEIYALVEEAIATDGWIIEGNGSKTHELRWRRAHMIIWLDLPRWLCLWRAAKRMVKNYGRSRPDMAPGCDDRFSWALVRWIWDFPQKNGPKVERLFEVSKNHCLHSRLRSPEDVEVFIQKELPLVLDHIKKA